MSETKQGDEIKTTPPAVNLLSSVISVSGEAVKDNGVDSISDIVFARRGTVMPIRELSNFMQDLVWKLGVRPVANVLKVNPGLIMRVEDGMESPSVRRAIGIRKNPRRWRIIIEDDEELYRNYKTLLANSELSSPELLCDMMRVYKERLDTLGSLYAKLWK